MANTVNPRNSKVFSREPSQRSNHTTTTSSTLPMNKTLYQDDISGLLIERMEAWRQFVKGVIMFFTEIAKNEKASAESYRRCSKMNLISDGKTSTEYFFGESEFFKTLGESFQTIPHKMAVEHEAIGKSIENETLTSLKKLKKEIKQHQKKIGDAIINRRKDMTRSRDDLEKTFTALRNSIHAYQGYASKNSDPNSDPWLLHLIYKSKESKFLKQHGERESARDQEVKEYMAYEGTIFVNFKNAISSFTNWEDLKKTRPEFWQGFRKILQDADNKSDSDKFFAKLREYGSEPRPEAPPGTIDQEAIKILKEGVMLRPKRITGWKEKYFVLTAAGFLHEFEKQHDWSSVDTDDLEVLQSIPLNHCILGAHSIKDKTPQEFQIVEQKPSFLSKGAREIKLRGEDLQKAVTWWKALAPHVRMTLTSEYVPLETSLKPQENPDISKLSVSEIAAAAESRKSFQSSSLSRKSITITKTEVLQDRSVSSQNADASNPVTRKKTLTEKTFGFFKRNTADNKATEA